MPGRPTDYTDRRYGRLVAIRPLYCQNRGWIWEFECDCGAVVERRAENVVSSAHAGNEPKCSKRCKFRKPVKTIPEPLRLEIEGETFGKLTALEYTGRIDNRRYAIWKFRCSCGNIVERSAGSVVSSAIRGREPHCGSKKCSNLPRLPHGEAARNKLFSQYRRSATTRGLELTLTNEQMEEIFKGECFYCGCPPSMSSRHKYSTGDFKYNGIDRVDNKKGYIPGNVVSCCWKCNHAKSDMSQDEFLQWIWRLIIRWKDDKTITTV